MAASMRVIYLPGVAGFPKLSPALEGLGVDVVVPDLPGFSGAPGFESPPDYLGWLTAVWDALDRTGALPCPVIGASVGGMLAADLAALRPEAVTRLALIAPLGIFDDKHPGEDLFTLTASHRLEVLFAGAVPDAFENMFEALGTAEKRMADYVVSIAVASLLWPLTDRGLRARVHRIRMPSLLVWGDQDRVAPVALAEHWPLGAVVTIPGGGHLVEWDEPDAVQRALHDFLFVEP